MRKVKLEDQVILEYISRILQKQEEIYSIYKELSDTIGDKGDYLSLCCIDGALSFNNTAKGECIHYDIRKSARDEDGMITVFINRGDELTVFRFACDEDGNYKEVNEKGVFDCELFKIKGV